MITWLNLFEISLLIHLQLFELDQKRNWVSWSFISKRNLGGSKVKRHAYVTTSIFWPGSKFIIPHIYSDPFRFNLLNWIKIDTPLAYSHGVTLVLTLLFSDVQNCWLSELFYNFRQRKNDRSGNSDKSKIWLLPRSHWSQTKPDLVKYATFERLLKV